MQDTRATTAPNVCVLVVAYNAAVTLARTLDRLPAVDRAILRVAVWELLHAEDVPEPVAVDEAVELAKRLSTDDSPGFVNGVLGQVMLVTPQIRAAAAAVRAGSNGADGTAG